MSSELNNCPKCGLDFNKNDIYQHFLKEYTDNWPYKYATTVERILQSIKQYPELYNKDRVPSEEKIRSLSEIELNAWWSACSYGWTFDKPVSFRKDIGIEIQGYYDGVVLWECPECGYIWKRFDWVSDEVLEAYIREKTKKSEVLWVSPN